MIQLNNNNFIQEVLSEKVLFVLVDVISDFCVQCFDLDVKLRKIENDNKYNNKLKFCQYNIRQPIYNSDKEGGKTLVDKYNITAIPTLLLFKGGRLIKTLVSNVSIDTIYEWLGALN